MKTRVAVVISRCCMMIMMVTILLKLPGVMELVTHAQEPLTWSTPVAISDPDTFNWFPNIAVDIYGTPHVIWDGGLVPADKFTRNKKIVSLLMHTQLDGVTWQRPLDVFAAVQGGYTLENMPQASLSADQNGNLWLRYVGNVLYTSTKHANESAANWSENLEVSRDVVYTGQVLLDGSGVLHAVYDEPNLLENPYGRGINKITHLADIFYRRSLDGGQVWSSPVNLSRTEVGETQARIKIDAQGVIYVSWDEGWDRHMDEGSPRKGGLTVSYDGGRTWSPKITFSFPDHTNVQLVVSGDNDGNALAVWRTTSRKEIYYSWSTDQGVSWSEPKAIPNLFARSWEDTFSDSYDLAVDGLGVFHLVGVGRLHENHRANQLYHLTWDGQNWSEPNPVFVDPGWAEAPRLAISQGNQLHMVWFVRDRLDLAYHSRYQVWYNHVTTDAFAEPLPAAPTPTPQPTATPAPTPNLTPTVPKTAITKEELSAIRGIDTDGGMITDDDLPILLARSVAPLAVIVAALIIGRRFIGGRRKQ